MTITAYHAKYFAHDLTRRASSGLDRLSMSLFDAAVDLNPHQIEAAVFALESPLSKGVILADEVGLGKTIEAGIVLCQFWAERKRRLLVICPASLRKQWALELEEKFNLKTWVLDAKANREAQRSGRAPLNEKAVLIMSFNYANAMREELKAIAWDLVVIDEAHKLRNAYRPSNKVGQGIRWATEDCRKLLLTATPLQNSLLELYGLSTLIDEHLFGDLNSFRTQYASAGSSIAELRQRLSGFCKRTLRNQVTEYIRYTERRPITRPFSPSDNEQDLYDAVSAFLQRPDSYALPQRQRHLTALILRKLLASSSQAIAATLDKLRIRLETLRDDKVQDDPELAEDLIESEELEDDLLDETLGEAGAEAAAEGINLQFCSLVINYDLPWNPQRIEQRIGRCHRYRQRHDVVVINFLNERNEADRRVLELLGEKFSLFSGVFGASDEVLGTIESGVDFEKRILAIYQQCRTPAEIDAAFGALQAELDESIRVRMDDTRRKLFEHFDEDVHQRLRLQLDAAKAQLDRFGQRFWSLTRFMLDGRARFDDEALAFDLERPPADQIAIGRYPLISKSHPRAAEDGGEEHSQFLYRLTKQGYSARDSEFDLIYVNGGNNLENLKTADERWKVRLLEEDFHRLMFEMDGV